MREGDFYEPDGWAWLAVGCAFATGVFVNADLGQGPLSIVGLFPSVLGYVLIAPERGEQLSHYAQLESGRRPVRPWWRGRSAAGWVSAWRRTGFAALVCCAVFTAESVFHYFGFGFITD